MIRFLIYLFESGMCLALLFLVYFLFLRKETYFTFNRIYLLSILILSFALPLLQMNITLPGSQTMENRAAEIRNVKDHYERLIAMTDPEYRNSFTKAFTTSKSNNFEESGLVFSSGNSKGEANSEDFNDSIKTGFWADVNWARLLLILYLLGTLFFTVRLLLLFWWLKQTVNKYGSTFEDGVKLVKMNEEVPPFSFFRFVFLHGETTSHSGFSQILAHEKVHIAQRHSLDLMLVHLFTILQWFNPFAWLINKAMKTNHEYIADRSVVDQGYELFDYQSLLLKQMISIRSVELVNNFNLINIKKRIAMMTKIKSGLAAQVKALVVIPAAMFVFFFFAEITFAQNVANPKIITEKLQGFWQNETPDNYGKLLYFDGNKIQILEDRATYREFPFEIGKPINSYPSLVIKNGKQEKTFQIVFDKEGLLIAWNSPLNMSRYKKSQVINSLEWYSNLGKGDFLGVKTSYYRLAEEPENTFRLLLNKDGKLFAEGITGISSMDNLPKLFRTEKESLNPFDGNSRIPIISIDGRCKMEAVTDLYNKMREMDELKYILSVYPADKKVPEIFYHNVGIPRLLPPKDAKMLEENAVEKSGMKIIRVDLTKPETTPAIAAGLFTKEIQKDKKFVVLLSYRNSTSCQEYMSVLDEFYKVIFTKRDQLAREKYQLGYDELADAQQQEVRKSYPMVITEKNVDMPEE